MIQTSQSHEADARKHSDPHPRRSNHEISAWAVIAAIVLFVVGLMAVFGGVQFVIRGLAHGADSGGVREVMTGFGGVLLVAGIAHVYAAILIWAHRDAGGSFGILIGAIGTLLGAVVFAVALRSALDPSPGSAAPNLTGLLLPIPHLIVLIGLLIGRDHFPKASASRSPRHDDR